MLRKHQWIRSVTMLLVLFLNPFLLTPDLSAQTEQTDHLLSPAYVSPEVATAHIVERKTSRVVAAPRTVVPETLFDAGTVAAGTEITHSFKVKNGGKGDLVIDRVEPG